MNSEYLRKQVCRFFYKLFREAIRCLNAEMRDLPSHTTDFHYPPAVFVARVIFLWLIHWDQETFLSLAQGQFSFSQRWAEYCLPTTSYFSIFVTAQSCFTCSSCVCHILQIYTTITNKLAWNKWKYYSLSVKRKPCSPTKWCTLPSVFSTSV